MAVFSKNRYQLKEHLPCSVLHPWTTSCTYNTVDTFLQALKGSSNYFLVIYLLQLVLKHRNYDKSDLAELVVTFARSCLLCGFCASTSMAVMCFLRWLRGKHTVSSLGFIPGMVGGVGIFIEAPSRRAIDVTLLIALVADLYLKLIQDKGLFTLTSSMQFLIFASCSSVLAYMLRANRDACTSLWPFTPHKLPAEPEARKLCAHRGDCVEYVKKTGSTYFYYGVAIQMLKVIGLHFRKLYFRPTSFLRAFFKLNNLRLPLFAGLYISLFQGVSCFLRSYRGMDEAWHALPAGAIASIPYILQPSLSLALLAFSNLSQIVCRKYRKKLGLPAWPWKEFVFILCIGLLYYARAAFPALFPSYMMYIMDLCTNGRSRVVYGLVEEHLLLRL